LAMPPAGGGNGPTKQPLRPAEPVKEAPGARIPARVRGRGVRGRHGWKEGSGECLFPTCEEAFPVLPAIRRVKRKRPGALRAVFAAGVMSRINRHCVRAAEQPCAHPPRYGLQRSE
jgi:hypothetical protein